MSFHVEVVEEEVEQNRFQMAARVDGVEQLDLGEVGVHPRSALDAVRAQGAACVAVLALEHRDRFVPGSEGSIGIGIEGDLQSRIGDALGPELLAEVALEPEEADAPPRPGIAPVAGSGEHVLDQARVAQARSAEGMAPGDAMGEHQQVRDVAGSATAVGRLGHIAELRSGQRATEGEVPVKAPDVLAVDVTVAGDVAAQTGVSGAIAVAVFLVGVRPVGAVVAGVADAVAVAVAASPQRVGGERPNPLGRERGGERPNPLGRERGHALLRAELGRARSRKHQAPGQNRNEIEYSH